MFTVWHDFYFTHNFCLAPREQLNQITSWFDASMVYGSTQEVLDELRDTTQSGANTSSQVNSFFKQMLDCT